MMWAGRIPGQRSATGGELRPTCGTEAAHLFGNINGRPGQTHLRGIKGLGGKPPFSNEEQVTGRCILATRVARE